MGANQLEMHVHVSLSLPIISCCGMYVHVHVCAVSPHRTLVSTRGPTVRGCIWRRPVREMLWCSCWRDTSTSSSERSVDSLVYMHTSFVHVCWGECSAVGVLYRLINIQYVKEHVARHVLTWIIHESHMPGNSIYRLQQLSMYKCYMYVYMYIHRLSNLEVTCC